MVALWGAKGKRRGIVLVLVPVPTPPKYSNVFPKNHPPQFLAFTACDPLKVHICHSASFLHSYYSKIPHRKSLDFFCERRWPFGEKGRVLPPPISRLVSTPPFLKNAGFSTFDNLQTMIDTPKEAPWKMTPKRLKGLVSPIQSFSAKSANRFFFEVWFWTSEENLQGFGFFLSC